MERPLRMRMSGRSLESVSGGTLGRSHEGMRVAETEGGKRELEVASMMVYQAEGDVDRVFWRQRVRIYICGRV